MNAYRSARAQWGRLHPDTRRALWGTVGVLNARAPRRFNRVLQLPSFFWAWFITEGAFPFLVLHAIRVTGSIRRGRSGVEGALTSALNVATAAGLVSFIAEGRQTDDQFQAALAPYLSASELAARPHSVRAGAWIPVIYGGRHRRTRTRNVVFSPPGPGRPLHLDVYRPVGDWDGGERRPALIQIHGGAWLLGDKREQGIPLLNHMAANGWVGFNVNYSLSPRARAPQHLIDVKRAISWIREHADEFGIDPDFICVTGGSAGGHLCALAALTENNPQFQPGFEDADTSIAAALPFYGVYDMADLDHHMIDGFVKLLIEPVVFGAKYSADPAPFESYSPIHHVHPDAPPMMIIHGSRDALVAVESARPFAAKMADVSKNASIYVELYGAQHAFDVFPSPRTVRTIEYCQQFLDGVHRGVIK